MDLDRRRLLIGSAVGGGLLLGWSLLPRDEAPVLAAGAGELARNGWLKLGTDGVLTVAVPALDMGQGVSTLLARVAAHELGADWRRVALAPVPPSAAHANAPLAGEWAEMWLPGYSGALDGAGWLARRWARGHRFTATAAGTALAAWEAPLREAAASARALLAMAAARRWGVDWQACEVAGGMVRHGGQALAFAKLVGDAAKLSPPAAPPLRPDPPRDSAATTTAFPRLDLPAQVDGSLQFAADIRLPGMVYAALRHAPPGAATLATYDPALARGVPGFIRLVPGPDWLAAVGATSWAAERALAAVAPRFKVHAPIDSVKIEAALDRALHSGKGQRIAALGDPDGVLAGPLPLTRRYEAAPATHAMLECASATVRLRGTRAELWLATQAPEAARLAVAGALGLSVEDVVLYPVPAGGSFDRRLDHAHAVQAALVAKAVGRPVQLSWSRWQEAVAGLPRPPVVAELGARLAPSGELYGWKARIAVPASWRELGRRLFHHDSPAAAMAASAGAADHLAVAGAMPPYAVPHLLVEHVAAEIGLPTGPMRGGADGYTAFFTESFIDELAEAGQHEPLSFRMGLLGDDPRLAQCLQRVSALGGWNGGGDRSGQGIACHRIGSRAAGGCIAAVAIARRDERGLVVERIAAVADIGRIVHHDLARQQIEGGLVFGIGLAIGSALTYADGLPSGGRLADLNLPRLADCPEIAVEFIESSAPPFDPGDLGVAVAAPVVANALASATGLRFRKLPLVADT